jgi:hypothetical protein
MNNTKRQSYGVYTNTLGKVAKALADRVKSVLEQLTKRGYKDLNEIATQLYDMAVQYETLYGRKSGAKTPSVTGKRFHLLCSAKGALFMTYQYQHIDSDVRVCLEHGTPVTVFSPYKNPDMCKVTSESEWNILIGIERECNKTFYATKEYQDWQHECQIRLTATLNTPIPWIHDGYRLHTLADTFKSFDEFLTYVQGKIAQIEEQGEYDIELTTSLVMNEKASSAHMISKHGHDKGARTFWCADDPDAKRYWYNYEVMPVDILNKFIHLTYLNSIDYKPLKRVFTDGVDMSGKELWFGTAYEDMLRTTPLYVDLNNKHDKDIEVVSDELQEVVNAIGIDTIKKLGYKDAKASILFNLKNR